MSLLSSSINYVADKNFIYQFCATTSVYLLIKLVLFLQVRKKRFRLFENYGIPVPKLNIIDGSFAAYRANANYHLADVRWHAKYGKTFGTFIGDQPQMMTTDLELLRKVFIDNVDSFKKRMPLFIDTPVNSSILFAENYNKWRLFRRLISSKFSSYKVRGSESLEFVETSVKLMLDYIEGKFESCQKIKDPKIELDVHELMKATTLHMISQMAIDLPDVKVKEHEDHVKALDVFLDRVGDGAVVLVVRFPFLKGLIEFLAKHVEYDTALKMINRSLNKAINDKVERLQAGTCGRVGANSRLLDVLIQAHHDKALTKEEVMANCIAILIAGYDTTSTTLAYLFWVFAKYVKVQEKLRAELMIYGIESQYLDQVIDETMRLYPVVVTFAARTATETVDFGDIIIPCGTRVNYNSWLVHRDPEIWPEPNKFDPDRFAPGVERHPCAYAPFGLGSRKCPGQQLAKMEVKMIMCDILLRYKLNLVSPDELEICTHSNVLSKPKDKIRVELERL